MCFSATASFTVAAATAAAGIATLANVRFAREVLLAAVPLIFAMQQATEGILWLLLEDGANRPGVAALTRLYLIFAEVVWPALTPAAVVLIEPNLRRRRMISAIAALGVLLALYLLVQLFVSAPAVAIRLHSLQYGSGDGRSLWINLPYLLFTCGPPLLSSHRIIRAFGAVVFVDFAVSAYGYYATLLSVWCFFAAAASTLLYLHFVRAARMDPAAAVPLARR